MRSAFLVLFLAVGLSACAPSLQEPALPATAGAADGWDNWYRQARAQGVKVLHVDPARSVVAIEVRRAGPLAGLGHDHVVASRDVQGLVAPERGRADLAIALDALTVDENALRAEAGMTTQPPADAIEGTRRNMLDKVLEAQRYPLARVRVERSADGAPLQVVLVLHGVERRFQVPARVETVGDELRVAGRMELRQTDFGMTPFSVLGGALRVEDRLVLRFSITADAQVFNQGATNAK